MGSAVPLEGPASSDDYLASSPSKVDVHVPLDMLVINLFWRFSPIHLVNYKSNIMWKSVAWPLDGGRAQRS